MATLCDNCRLVDLHLHSDRAALLKLLEENEDSFGNTKIKVVPRNVEFVDGGGAKLLLAEADGFLVSRNVQPDIIERVHTFRARDDDILLATYPKCGTHWMTEILGMLADGRTNLLEDYTVKNIEYFPMDALDNAPSPRILSTHMPFSRVPRDFLSRGCKMVWVVRSPWDVAVSFYHFVRKLTPAGYEGEWSGFFELFLDGHVPFGSYFEHTQEWLKAMAIHDNILMVRYEDLHTEFKAEVKKIADFLGKQVSDAMLETLERETSFANMSQKKSSTCVTKLFSRTGQSILYRKGTCNDWENYFTEQQSVELRGAYRVSLGAHNHILRYCTRCSFSEPSDHVNANDNVVASDNTNGVDSDNTQ